MLRRCLPVVDVLVLSLSQVMSHGSNNCFVAVDVGDGVFALFLDVPSPPPPPPPLLVFHLLHDVMMMMMIMTYVVVVVF